MNETPPEACPSVNATINYAFFSHSFALPVIRKRLPLYLFSHTFHRGEGRKYDERPKVTLELTTLCKTVRDGTSAA